MAVGPRPPARQMTPDDAALLRGMAAQLVQQATLLQDNARALREMADAMDGRSDD